MWWVGLKLVCIVFVFFVFVLLFLVFFEFCIGNLELLVIIIVSCRISLSEESNVESLIFIFVMMMCVYFCLDVYVLVLIVFMCLMLWDSLLWIVWWIVLLLFDFLVGFVMMYVLVVSSRWRYGLMGMKIVVVFLNDCVVNGFCLIFWVR